MVLPKNIDNKIVKIEHIHIKTIVNALLFFILESILDLDFDDDAPILPQEQENDDDTYDLQKELDLIKINIVAVHILTKLFLQDMVEVNRGHIMNVASIAGFMPGPLMATYYSTKAYVVRLTQSIRQELFMKHSKVKISALCPGPVNTNFNKVADVKFNLAEANSKQVAKYAVRKMSTNKILIFPSLTMWLGRLLFKIMPDQLSAFFCYFAQKRKIS